ncbi:MAG: hypothetical protein RL695_288 [Pseudomonadota bacterium]|jgi:hypothetical protein
MTMTNETSGNENHAEMEAFPNVLNKIQAMWGTQECDSFLQGLFMDTRGGSRRGFPMEAGAEILFLTKFNKVVRAVPLAEKLKVPYAEAFRIIDQGDQHANAPTSGTDVWSDPGNATEFTGGRSPANNTRREQPSSYVPLNIAQKKSKKSGSVLVWIIVIALLAIGYRLFSTLFKSGV